jgi:AcrR family transcriptional regulator
MPATVDRRIARTRRSLRESLILLLRRKNYDDITVQDIIDEADVGRSTFYAHCSGKEDLLRRGLQMLRPELAEGRSDSRAPQARTLTFSLKMLEHVTAHRDVYPALGRSRGREILLRELRLVALELLRENLDAMSLDESVPRELAEQHIVGAFMSVLVWHLERKPNYSLAQLDAMFQRLVLRGISRSPHQRRQKPGVGRMDRPRASPQQRQRTR